MHLAPRESGVWDSRPARQFASPTLPTVQPAGYTLLLGSETHLYFEKESGRCFGHQFRMATPNRHSCSIWSHAGPVCSTPWNSRRAQTNVSPPIMGNTHTLKQPRPSYDSGATRTFWYWWKAWLRANMGIFRRRLCTTACCFQLSVKFRLERSGRTNKRSRINKRSST